MLNNKTSPSSSKKLASSSSSALSSSQKRETSSPSSALPSSQNQESSSVSSVLPLSSQKQETLSSSSALPSSQNQESSSVSSVLPLSSQKQETLSSSSALPSSQNQESSSPSSALPLPSQNQETLSSSSALSSFSQKQETSVSSALPLSSQKRETSSPFSALPLFSQNQETSPSSVLPLSLQKRGASSFQKQVAVQNFGFDMSLSKDLSSFLTILRSQLLKKNRQTGEIVLFYECQLLGLRRAYLKKTGFHEQAPKLKYPELKTLRFTKRKENSYLARELGRPITHFFIVPLSVYRSFLFIELNPQSYEGSSGWIEFFNKQIPTLKLQLKRIYQNQYCKREASLWTQLFSHWKEPMTILKDDVILKSNHSFKKKIQILFSLKTNEGETKLSDVLDIIKKENLKQKILFNPALRYDMQKKESQKKVLSNPALRYDMQKKESQKKVLSNPALRYDMQKKESQKKVLSNPALRYDMQKKESQKKMLSQSFPREGTASNTLKIKDKTYQLFYHSLKRDTETLFYAQDMSRYFTLKEQLFQTEKMLELFELGQNMAHQINNPLTGVRAMTQILSCSPSLKKFQDEFQELEKAIDRSHRIIQSFLSFSKVEKASKSCDLNQVIEDSLPLLKSMTRRISLIKNLHNGELKVKGDFARFQQITYNLILNACQSLLEDKDNLKPELKIQTTKTAGDKVCMKIIDNGKGIPKENLETIFKPLWTSRKNGTGFGLGITKNNVKKCGGDIFVSSEERKETCFKVSFPLYRPETLFEMMDSL